MLGDPGVDRHRQEMLADQRLADDVAVDEDGRGRVRGGVVKVDALVGCDLENSGAGKVGGEKGG